MTIVDLPQREVALDPRRSFIVQAPAVFREAAERTLWLVEKDETVSPLARAVLRHLDGDWSAVRGLVEGMLRRRDQWMRRIEGFTAEDEVRHALEEAFRKERARVMQRAI